MSRDSQKGIIIGHQEAKSKKVGMEARKDIEKFFDKSVFLELFVKSSRIGVTARTNCGRLAIWNKRPETAPEKQGEDAACSVLP